MKTLDKFRHFRHFRHDFYKVPYEGKSREIPGNDTTKCRKCQTNVTDRYVTGLLGITARSVTNGVI